MEILVLFAIGIISLIVGISQSSSKQKANKKTEEITKKASNFIDTLGSIYKVKIYTLCGVDFLVFYEVSIAILEKNLSPEQEELLVKTNVLSKDEDIRLLGEEELINTIMEWTKLMVAKLISKNQISPKEAAETMKKLSKARTLIEMIRSKYQETYGEEFVALYKSFVNEQEHTEQSCDYVLNEMKRMTNEVEQKFEEELLTIKEKYLSFADIGIQN